MAQGMIDYVLRALVYYAPMWFAYLLAFCAAVFYRRKAPTAWLLVCAGVTVMFLGDCVRMLGQGYVITGLNDGEWEPDGVESNLAVVGVVSGCGQALGLGLIVLAVFLGRRPRRD